MAAVINYHKCNTETSVAKNHTGLSPNGTGGSGDLNDSHWAKAEVLARQSCLAQALGEHPFPHLFLLLGAHILLCSLLPSEPGQRWRVESPQVTPIPHSLIHPLMRSPVANLRNPEQSPRFRVFTLIPSAEALLSEKERSSPVPAMTTCTALGTVTLSTQSPPSGAVSASHGPQLDVSWCQDCDGQGAPSEPSHRNQTGCHGVSPSSPSFLSAGCFHFANLSGDKCLTHFVGKLGEASSHV